VSSTGSRRRHRAFARQVALVARREYLRTVRRRGFVAGTLLLPLAMGFVFGISALSSTSFGQGSSGPIFVVNESATPLTPDARITPNVNVVDRAEAEQRLADHTVSEYFVVPAAWPGQAVIQVVGADRPLALARLRRALDETVVTGLPTTLAFHRWLAADERFARAELATDFVERAWDGAEERARVARRAALAAANAASRARSTTAQADSPGSGRAGASPDGRGPLDRQGRADGWRNVALREAAERWPAR